MSGNGTDARVSVRCTARGYYATVLYKIRNFDEKGVSCVPKTLVMQVSYLKGSGRNSKVRHLVHGDYATALVV